MNIWCLHGNLQKPSVWDRFSSSWSTDASRLQLNAPDIWTFNTSSFGTWTTEFCQHVRNTTSDAPGLLIGYSLGGRLALHAILKDPTLWAGVVVIGAHPGLKTQEERDKQLEWDQSWANRFLNEPWQKLLDTWDSLPVFCGRSSSILRQEATFSRAQIASTFDTFSKGRQTYLTPSIAQLTMPPILFISGEEDQRYTTLGMDLDASCPIVTHKAVAQAGHRVPWENPLGFTNIVQRFITDILS